MADLDSDVGFDIGTITLDEASEDSTIGYAIWTIAGGSVTTADSEIGFVIENITNGADDSPIGYTIGDVKSNAPAFWVWDDDYIPADLYIWDDTIYRKVNEPSDVSYPIYPPRPPMIPGWVPHNQQIDTSVDQGWTHSIGVRSTDSAINRPQNTQFGVGPTNDAMLITVTYDGSNYYSSDAQARFCPLPQFHVVEYYAKMGPVGSGWFPAVWERPYGSGDGEIDWWEGRGKWYNTPPVGLHPNLFMMNAITTLNGSYANKAQRPRPINITNPVIDITEWHHYRHRLDATSMTTWIDGVKVGEILRSAAGAITNSEWDRCFTGHQWYLRVTQQFGLGSNADTGGPADPSICPNYLWLRDVRLYKPA